MTLGGLALAIGILVDEATVEIENIHTQMAHAPSIAKAVRMGNAQTAVPRLLAMVCILAVFISSLFMQGAPRAMFCRCRWPSASRWWPHISSPARFTVPNFWADPKTGIGYQVQVEIPRPVVRSPKGITPLESIADLEMVPVKRSAAGQVLVRDVASVSHGSMPGEIDRYNMKRQVSMTANVVGTDLGRVSREVAAALERAGDPPTGAKVEVRGQIPPMREMLSGLGIGLGLAIVVIFLLLSANFQSLRLSLVAVSTVPAVVAGVVVMLSVTRSTLNIQSFIGAIMAVGVAMANAILLVAFAEGRRRRGAAADAAAVGGASSRLRAVLMTTCAMMAGMLPMALALGESGQQNAPLGRAVIGGLAAATAATARIVLHERPNACVLPQSAGKQAFCWVARNGQAARTPITVGIQVGNDVEVTSGLKGDEPVVQSPPGSLKDGQPIEVTKGR